MTGTDPPIIIAMRTKGLSRVYTATVLFVRSPVLACGAVRSDLNARTQKNFPGKKLTPHPHLHHTLLDTVYSSIYNKT